mgnify:CR=1 FL=1
MDKIKGLVIVLCVGLMLTFMFLVNMLGAMLLLPALGAWLLRTRAAAAPAPGG